MKLTIAIIVTSAAIASGQHHNIRLRELELDDLSSMSMAASMYGGGYGGSGTKYSGKSGKEFICNVGGSLAPDEEFCTLSSIDGVFDKTCGVNRSFMFVPSDDGTLTGTSSYVDDSNRIVSFDLIGYWNKSTCSFKVVETGSSMTIEGNVSNNNIMKVEATAPGLVIAYQGTFKNVCP